MRHTHTHTLTHTHTHSLFLFQSCRLDYVYDALFTLVPFSGHGIDGWRYFFILQGCVLLVGTLHIDWGAATL